MIVYSTALAKPWHCGALARKVRDEQIEIAIGLNRNAHRDIRSCFDNSGFVRSLVTPDGRVVGMGGVLGSLVSPEGTIWAVVSKEAASNPRLLTSHAVRTLTYLRTVKRRLYAAPFAADKASVRFAEWLGFKRIEDETGEYMKIGGILMALGEG